jgi:hypothetical protein
MKQKSGSDYDCWLFPHMFIHFSSVLSVFSFFCVGCISQLICFPPLISKTSVNIPFWFKRQNIIMLYFWNRASLFSPISSRSLKRVGQIILHLLIFYFLSYIQSLSLLIFFILKRDMALISRQYNLTTQISNKRKKYLSFHFYLNLFYLDSKWHLLLSSAVKMSFILIFLSFQDIKLLLVSLCFIPKNLFSFTGFVRLINSGS